MTPKQQELLAYVRNYFSEHGRAPTQRTISRALGRPSVSSINGGLKTLTDYGYLRRIGQSAGCYVPVEAEALALQAVSTKALLAELQRREKAGEAQ